MEIVRKIDRAQAQKLLDGSLSLKASKDNPIFFSSRNTFAMENRDQIQSMDKHKQETNDENDSVLLVIDDLNPNLDLFGSLRSANGFMENCQFLFYRVN